MTGKYLQVLKKATSKTSVQVITCPKCSSTLSVKAVGYTITIVCDSCGSILELEKSHPIIKGMSTQMRVTKQCIPLGARGKLHGTIWEVIGFLKRKNFQTRIVWQEYLLFNPYKGFRWLVEYNGHWNYVNTLHSVPTVTGIQSEHANYLNTNYNYLTTYNSKTIYVAGEFYWRVMVGETAQIVEYINTPEILTQEKTSDDIIWSLAEYLDRNEVAEAFDIPKRKLPVKKEYAVNQPSSTRRYLSQIVKTYVVGLLIFFTLSYFAAKSSDPKEILLMNFVAPTAERFEIVSPSFNIDTHRGVVAYQIKAPIDNAWLELETELVNETTGETVNHDTGLEYYSGYDAEDRTYWTEGSQVGSLTITTPKEGRYHLNISAKNNDTFNLPIELSIREGVFSISNFLFSFFLLSLWPGLLLLNELFFYSRKHNWWDDDD